MEKAYQKNTNRYWTHRKQVNMSLTLNTEQKVRLSIAPVTSSGKPAALDGAPTWVSSDESVITVQVSTDGLSAEVLTTDEVGSATVTVSADADLGEGVQTIQASLDIISVHPQASNLGLVVGPPENK